MLACRTVLRSKILGRKVCSNSLKEKLFPPLGWAYPPKDGPLARWLTSPTAHVKFPPRPGTSFSSPEGLCYTFMGLHCFSGTSGLKNLDGQRARIFHDNVQNRSKSLPLDMSKPCWSSKIQLWESTMVLCICLLCLSLKAFVRILQYHFNEVL